MYSRCIVFSVLTCSWRVRLNVAVNVETAVHEDEELADPLAALEVVQVTSTVGLGVGRGWHQATLSGNLQPDIVLSGILLS